MNYKSGLILSVSSARIHLGSRDVWWRIRLGLIRIFISFFLFGRIFMKLFEGAVHRSGAEERRITFEMLHRPRSFKLTRHEVVLYLFYFIDSVERRSCLKIYKEALHYVG